MPIQLRFSPSPTLEFYVPPFVLIKGASGLWNHGGAAAGGTSGTAPFSSGPTPGTTVEDAANAGYPDWMIHEDYALLQAIQVFFGCSRCLDKKKFKECS